jgi:hypothetical protein
MGAACLPASTGMKLVMRCAPRSSNTGVWVYREHSNSVHHVYTRYCKCFSGHVGSRRGVRTSFRNPRSSNVSGLGLHHLHHGRNEVTVCLSRPKAGRYASIILYKEKKNSQIQKTVKRSCSSEVLSKLPIMKSEKRWYTCKKKQKETQRRK